LDGVCGVGGRKEGEGTGLADEAFGQEGTASGVRVGGFDEGGDDVAGGNEGDGARRGAEVEGGEKAEELDKVADDDNDEVPWRDAEVTGRISSLGKAVFHGLVLPDPVKTRDPGGRMLQESRRVTIARRGEVVTGPVID
jgi:hypothetical protein